MLILQSRVLVNTVRTEGYALIPQVTYDVSVLQITLDSTVIYSNTHVYVYLCV